MLTAQKTGLYEELLALQGYDFVGEYPHYNTDDGDRGVLGLYQVFAVQPQLVRRWLLATGLLVYVEQRERKNAPERVKSWDDLDHEGPHNSPAVLLTLTAERVVLPQQWYYDPWDDKPIEIIPGLWQHVRAGHAVPQTDWPRQVAKISQRAAMLFAQGEDFTWMVGEY